MKWGLRIYNWTILIFTLDMVYVLWGKGNTYNINESFNNINFD